MKGKGQLSLKTGSEYNPKTEEWDDVEYDYWVFDETLIVMNVRDDVMQLRERVSRLEQLVEQLLDIIDSNEEDED